MVTQTSINYLQKEPPRLERPFLNGKFKCNYIRITNSQHVDYSCCMREVKGQRWTQTMAVDLMQTPDAKYIKPFRHSQVRSHSYA